MQGNSEDFRFTAGVTRTPHKAQAFCRAQGIRLAGDLGKILQDPDIDALILATPNNQHEEQIRQAAGAEKHVFVEKPFTLDSNGASAAIQAVTDAGVVLAVGFNRRFHPSIGELRSRVKTGQLGIIGSIVAELTATTAFYRPGESWRWSPAEEPAGALAGIGIWPRYRNRKNGRQRDSIPSASN